MAFNGKLGSRIREALSNVSNVEEKLMFGGICFMVNDKMCVGVIKDDLLCRVGEEKYVEALGRKGCRQMEFSGRPSKGFVFVSGESVTSKKDFDYWICLCLEYNLIARPSRKKNNKK